MGRKIMLMVDIPASQMVKRQEIQAIRRRGGFTLIELVVVIAIIAVLTTIAGTLFLGQLPGIRLKEATRMLYFDIQSARLEALRNGATCTLQQLSGNGNGYQIIQGGTVLKTVYLDAFKGVKFGSLDNTAPNPDSGTFTDDCLTVQPSGLSNSGAFYLRNSEPSPDGRMITVSTLGKPSIKRWNGMTYN